jgi:hypothetical protein
MSRRNSSFASTGVQNWPELYKAALLERDQQTLPLRITEAERALILRFRKLFATSGDSSEEGQAVDSRCTHCGHSAFPWN